MRPQQNRRIRGRSNSNNNNNNRRGPNPLTRNYESNGPDVKIRGNAQHIADKYVALARDVQAAGDRVMAENYLQHAEHYMRIILSAQPQFVQSPRVEPNFDEGEVDNIVDLPLPEAVTERGEEEENHLQLVINRSDEPKEPEIETDSEEQKTSEEKTGEAAIPLEAPAQVERPRRITRRRLSRQENVATLPSFVTEGGQDSSDGLSATAKGRDDEKSNMELTEKQAVTEKPRRRRVVKSVSSKTETD